MIRHPVLDQLAAAGVKLGLDRIRAFLRHLGDPHLAVPTVHLAGTNGKGSTAMMVTMALVASGHRVCTLLSPHLEQVNERIRLDGVPLPDGELIEVIEHLDRARVDWAHAANLRDNPLTYFEFMVVAGFLVAAWRQVDVLVVETGMGGRLDATNVVDPVATAITSVGMDHVEVLGPTLADIAREKAGILKKGRPVVVGVLPPAAREVVEHRAKALGCTLWRPGAPLFKEVRKGRLNLSSPGGTLEGIQLGLQGPHQHGNALVALGLLHQLRQAGFHVPDDAIRQGFAHVPLPGRLEELQPGLIADGAHNAQAAEALAAWLARRDRPAHRILLFGMGQGRDPREVVEPLLPHVDEIVTTRCAHPKAAEPMELALLLQDHVADVALAAGEDVDTTLPEVVAEADEVLVAGSLFLAGAAASLVRAGQVPATGSAPRDGSVPPDGGSD